MFSRRKLLRSAGLGGLAIAGVHPFMGCALDPVLAPSDPPPDDPSKPWWLRQNYAPVEETETFELEVSGALPPEIRGLYLRNGPNPHLADSAHWFLGDGMIHGIRMRDGVPLWFRSRYVQTPLLAEEDTGAGPPGLESHQANTSILAYEGRLFCLEEVGLPFEVSPANLSTFGPYDFGGALKTAMTAHPKIDPVTGELLFFAYGVLEASATFHRADKSGKIVQTEKIALPKAVMMHDFQVTATHVVFMDLPILFDLSLAIQGEGFPYLWNPDNGARIGVMPRSGGAEDVVWIDIDPCFVFHTWNAWNDPADPSIIHLEGVRYPTMWASGPYDFSVPGVPTRFSISLTKKSVTVAPFEDLQMEFPRIHPGKQGNAYRYGYGIGGTAPGIDVGPNPPNTLYKVDREKNETKRLALPDGHVTDEATFVPAPDATSEDDGWLLSYVFDHGVNRSHLLVVDASNMSVVSRVLLPVRVPHGFHGDFVSDADS